MESPIVIGGVGGSGTRLLAQCLMKMGCHMGQDLNRSLDNMWFTILFKRPEILNCEEHEFARLIETFTAVTTNPGPLSRMMISQLNRWRLLDRPNLLRSLLRHAVQRMTSKSAGMSNGQQWGWKEPNSHILLERLRKYFPQLRYIHVVRNGLDMAHSQNDNQLKMWGPHVLHETCEVSPRNSLRYWCEVQRRAVRQQDLMGEQFLMLNFDQFCCNPQEQLDRLIKFVRPTDTNFCRHSIMQLIRPPKSIGRFKQYGCEIFRTEDVAYVHSQGFDTDERLAPQKLSA